MPGSFFDFLTGNYARNPQADPKVMTAADRGFLQENMAGGNPYLGANPYTGNWGSLITQLQAQAEGRGPSLAEGDYRRAAAGGRNFTLAASRGGSAAGARRAAMSLGAQNQGLAAGLAQARTGERIGASQALGSVLGAADQAQFARDQANQGAWLEMLRGRLGLTAEQIRALSNKPSNLDRLLGVGTALGAARIGAGGGGAGG